MEIHRLVWNGTVTTDSEVRFDHPPATPQSAELRELPPADGRSSSRRQLAATPESDVLVEEHATSSKYVERSLFCPSSSDLGADFLPVPAVQSPQGNASSYEFAPGTLC